MIQPGPAPMTRARSTNARSRSDSVWLRMIRAVAAQDVIPMTTTITTSVMRIPNSSAWVPMMSSRTGARIKARTNVGRTRKKSVMRMRKVSMRPPRNPLTIPINAPMKTVITVASSPTIMDTRVPWAVRLSMSRPCRSVPNR